MSEITLKISKMSIKTNISTKKFDKNLKKYRFCLILRMVFYYLSVILLLYYAMQPTTTVNKFRYKNNFLRFFSFNKNQQQIKKMIKTKSSINLKNS